MILLLGAAYEINDESVENDRDYAEKLLLTLCHSAMPSDERGTVTPIAVWASSEPNAEVRNADMHTKNLKAMLTPEFGLTEQGKKMLEDRMTEAAEQAAQEQAAGDTPSNN